MGNTVQVKNQMDKIWWVYILSCADGTLYTGCTTDLQRRVRQHNGEIRGGAKYTRTRRPVRLFGATQVGSRSDAQVLEARLKRLARQQKLSWCLEHGVKDA